MRWWRSCWGRVLSWAGEAEEAVTEEGAPVATRKPLIHTIGDLYRLKTRGVAEAGTGGREDCGCAAGAD